MNTHGPAMDTVMDRPWTRDLEDRPGIPPTVRAERRSPAGERAGTAPRERFRKRCPDRRTHV
ncbi:hypothetical protein GCM10009564_17320 [Streptomyces thermogriseus]|uniref:Uncharacterized protein n=1 Tax=Streptomyces thermogriseus TaxID=75292 RepID=A0ABP4DDX2_9ACTN